MKRPVLLTILGWLFGILAALKIAGILVILGSSGVRTSGHAMLLEVVSIPLYALLCAGFLKGCRWGRSLYMTLGIISLLIGLFVVLGKVIVNFSNAAEQGYPLTLLVVRGAVFGAVAYYLYRPSVSTYFENKAPTAEQLCRRGVAQMESGRLEDALKDFSRGLDSTRSSYERGVLLYNTAICHARAGRVAEAAAALRDAFSNYRGVRQDAKNEESFKALAEDPQFAAVLKEMDSR